MALAFYNVGTETQTTVHDLCKLILRMKRSGLEVDYRPYSSGDARQLVKNRIGSRRKVEEELGFRPSHTLEEGLRRLRAKEDVPPEVFRSTATLVREFVEDYHERLEENFIFPAFEKRKTLTDLETLWLDYVSELASEARADPAREATTVVIGIHPFVIGTPDGAAALRRVLSRLKKDEQVWLTDTDAILKAAGQK